MLINFPNQLTGEEENLLKKIAKMKKKVNNKQKCNLIQKCVAIILLTRKKKLFLEKKALLKESHSEPQGHEHGFYNGILF